MSEIKDLDHEEERSIKNLTYSDGITGEISEPFIRVAFGPFHTILSDKGACVSANRKPVISFQLEEDDFFDQRVEVDGCAIDVNYREETGLVCRIEGRDGHYWYGMIGGESIWDVYQPQVAFKWYLDRVPMSGCEPKIVTSDGTLQLFPGPDGVKIYDLTDGEYTNPLVTVINCDIGYERYQMTVRDIQIALTYSSVPIPSYYLEVNESGLLVQHMWYHLITGIQADLPDFLFEEALWRFFSTTEE